MFLQFIYVRRLLDWEAVISSFLDQEISSRSNSFVIRIKWVYFNCSLLWAKKARISEIWKIFNAILENDAHFYLLATKFARWSDMSFTSSFCSGSPFSGSTGKQWDVQNRQERLTHKRNHFSNDKSRSRKVSKAQACDSFTAQLRRESAAFY